MIFKSITISVSLFLLIFISSYSIDIDQKLLCEFSKDFVDKTLSRVIIIPKPKSNEKIQKHIFSLTATPEDYHHLKDIYKSSMKLLIPKQFRFYNDEKPEVPYYSIPFDFGPATKVLGLCYIKEDFDVVTYLDSDIVYDFERIKKLSVMTDDTKLLAGVGGLKLIHHDLPSISYDLSFWAYGYKYPSVLAEVLFGFGSVSLTKKSVESLCATDIRETLMRCAACFFIDDELLSFYFDKLKINKIVVPNLNPVLNHTLSDKKITSARKYYGKLIKPCFDCVYNTEPIHNNMLVKSFVSYQGKSVHAISEYKEIFSIIHKNHKIMSVILNYTYILERPQKITPAHWYKLDIIEDFLENCKPNESLFYTDFDFLFIGPIPIIPSGYSIMISRGCDTDYHQYMSGNIILSCDKDLLQMMDIWRAATKILHNLGEVADDQLAFNLVISKYMFKVFVKPFMVYDSCYYGQKVTGVHFPGPNKLKRIKDFMRN